MENTEGSIKEDIFDSNQEMYFAYWLEDLKQKGLVIDYVYEPAPFILSNDVKIQWNKQLKTKQKSQESKILSSLQYTIDFKVVWSEETDSILTYTDGGTYDSSPTKLIYRDSNNISYIEIKPSFNYQNMNRHVKVKIAWVYDKYGKYIQIISPFKLFRDTFFPNRYMTTDSKKNARKIKINGKYEEVSDILIFSQQYIRNNFLSTQQKD